MLREHTMEHLCTELKPPPDALGEVLSSPDKKSKGELSRIRSEAEQVLKQNRYHLGETGGVTAGQTRVAVARAGEYVRENP